MKMTWRVIYVVILLTVIVWQSIAIHRLNDQLAEARQSTLWWKESHRTDQVTIQELLIALGAMKP